MKLTHLVNGLKLSRKVKNDLSLFATNNLGGYLWLRPKNYSRYQGWFVKMEGELYKIVDELRVKRASQPKELRNLWKFQDCYLEQLRGGLKETFCLPRHKNTLIYKLSYICEIDLLLDIRKAYQTPQGERDYKIYKKDKHLLISYSYKKGRPLFLALPLDCLKKWQKIGRWIKKEAFFDKERNSPPYEIYVYHALKLRTGKLIFGAGLSEEEAIGYATFPDSSELTQETYPNNTNSSRLTQREKLVGTRTNLHNSWRELAYLLAKKSLASLLVYNKKGKVLGLFAGLPWFFQFWSRDEAISLKALFAIDYQASLRILDFLLGSIREDGRVPNLRGNPYSHFSLESADGIGWTLYRLGEAIEKLKIKAQKAKLKDFILTLETAIKRLLKHHTNQEGFAVNYGLETWMDTEVGGDNRAGVRIELQALRLNMYHLALRLTGKEKYALLEKELLRKTREKFLGKKHLKDGIEDETIRPNIFLAYYVYPQLLGAGEWENCFDEALGHLWLDWGGLATIAKDHPLFFPRHTGQDPKSYHRGDSWFWLNNLAALCMTRLNKEKYAPYIKKILKASCEDILWQAVAGAHSELSWAEKFEPAGSPVQAWSAAMFIELVDELIKRKT